jgi:hypothetical protein
MTALNIERARVLGKYAGHKWAWSEFFTDDLIRTADYELFVCAQKLDERVHGRKWRSDDLPRTYPNGMFFGVYGSHGARVAWCVRHDGVVTLHVFIDNRQPTLFAKIDEANVLSIRWAGDTVDAAEHAELVIWLSRLGFTEDDVLVASTEAQK